MNNYIPTIPEGLIYTSIKVKVISRVISDVSITKVRFRTKCVNNTFIYTRQIVINLNPIWHIMNQLQKVNSLSFGEPDHLGFR